jgi:6-pyruvoyltetrahydropterin/6-carboxytetrahydropterin synthase
MAGVFTVSTEILFCASHELEGYDGDCSRMHGHNWTVRAYYEFDRLDGCGLTVDFLQLKALLERIALPRFDHRHLNSVPPFDKVNPTSENIAAEIYRLLKAEPGFPGGRLAEVELWETPSDMVRYRE